MYTKWCYTSWCTSEHRQEGVDEIDDEAEMRATGKRPRPNQAAMRPTARAMMPASGVSVVSMMAGKVMTARVTYGT